MAHSQPARSTASTLSHNARQQPASLARRLLFPHLPPGSELPPLFVSPGCPPELNDEVYDFIALALRAFVNTWWSKLTRYDKELLPQVTNVVIHVIHALEQRLLDADLPRLVLADLPALVTQHYRDYRQAVSKVSTSYASGGALSVRQLFHQLQPHMAISADGTIDEEYFRQALDHVLKECLPAEDYAPEAERFIVREILVKVAVKDVIPRITQPWFLQRMALDMLGPFPDSSEQSLAPGFSKSSVIVLLLSAIQSLSGMCIMLIHAYKQALYIIPLVNQTRYPPAGRAILLDDSPFVSTTPSPAPSATSVPESKQALVYPDLTHGPLQMISEVLRVQDRLAATAVVQLVALICCTFRTFVNKLLCYVLFTYVLSASSILSVVRVSKRTLFPNGYPGTAPVDPTPEEQVAIRSELVKRIPLLDVDGVVEGLSDEACNRHLAVVWMDAILLAMFPEMGS